MENIKEIVKEIIDEWDPVNLFPYAPKDEYKDEIYAVTELVKQNKNRIEIAEGIQKIFIDWVGEKIFSHERCNESFIVAKKILKKLEEYKKKTRTET